MSLRPELAKTYLSELFEKGLEAAAPENCVPGCLPKRPKSRVFIVAAGKAAASMARAVELSWGVQDGYLPLQGIAVTRYGHGVACQHIEVIEAAHPVPDNRGELAARKILEMAEQLTEDDLLLCLISGGGSALLGLPADGIAFDEKKQINKALLLSGAPIGEMNVVRKHLSAIKGGRLAQAAFPASIHTIAISDVPGDDFSVIASGPTIADHSTSREALDILNKYQIKVPDHIYAHLENPASETPKPDNPIFQRCTQAMAAKPLDMVNKVCAIASEMGFKTINLGADIEGEAKIVGKEHAELALLHARKLAVADQPIAIISGGETTVTIEKTDNATDNKMGASGRGGRNCEYILSLALHLDGAPTIHALACDSDGIDGSEDNAGAFISPDSLLRGQAAGLSAEKMLQAHDSYSYFDKIGDLLKTGPTRTNVNDLRLILIFPPNA